MMFPIDYIHIHNAPNNFKNSNPFLSKQVSIRYIYHFYNFCISKIIFPSNVAFLLNILRNYIFKCLENAFYKVQLHITLGEHSLEK